MSPAESAQCQNPVIQPLHDEEMTIISPSEEKVVACVMMVRR